MGSVPLVFIQEHFLGYSPHPDLAGVVPHDGVPRGKDLGPETWKRTWDWGTPPVDGYTPVKTLPCRVPF